MDLIKVLEKIEEVVLAQETWIKMGLLVGKILFIILLAIVVAKIGRLIINRMFRFKVKAKIRPSERREKTLLKLLENTLSYVIYFSAAIAILDEFMNVSGLLASAGVLGLAIGFGAQSLVKDVISGFFIVFEDQFAVGDYVLVGSVEGTVEEIGLRTSKISAYGGEIHIIPNGNIVEVVNYSINNSLAILDVKIAYETDIEKAEKLIETFIGKLPESRYKELLNPPTLTGVQDLTSTEIVFRVLAETEPVMQWAFARKFRKDLKLFLDAHGIEIPYPKMITYQYKKENNDE